MSSKNLQGMVREDEYSVVINIEGQFSIWRLDLPLPEGWQLSGFTGKKQDCLDNIKEEWRDMRPLTLRNVEQQPSSQKSEKVL